MVVTFYIKIYHSYNMVLFRRFLGPYSPQIWSNIVEIITIDSILANKNIVWKFFWRIRVFRKRDASKVSTFGPTLMPRFPLKNFSYWAIQICQNQCFISSSLSGENAITTWAIFPGNRAESQVKGLELKFETIHPNDSWSMSCKKAWFQHFPVLWL